MSNTNPDSVPPPAGAPLDWLAPGPVRDKLAALVDARDRLNDAARGANDRANQTRQALNSARAAVANYDEQIRRSAHQPTRQEPLERRGARSAIRVVPDDRPRKRLEQTLANAERDAARANAAATEANEAAGPARAIVERVENYLRKIGPAGVSAAKPAPPPKLKAGVDPAVELDRVRGQIAAAHAAIADTRNADVPLSDVVKAIERQVDALASRGQPDVTPLFQGQRGRITFGRVELALGLVTSDGRGGFTTGSADDAMGLVAWLYRDDLIAALTAEAEAAADPDAEALTEAEKAERITALSAEILNHERVEEALVKLAADRGLVLSRRGATDPRAVLEIEGDHLPTPEPVQ